MSVGGSIESVTLDGRTYAVTGDAEVQRKVGGFENEIQPNGDGTARLIKTLVPWGLDGLVIDIDDDQGDQEFLQELQNRNDFFPITATYASGKVWQGTGQIVGETQYSNQSTTASVSLMGTGSLTSQ